MLVGVTVAAGNGRGHCSGCATCALGHALSLGVLIMVMAYGATPGPVESIAWRALAQPGAPSQGPASIALLDESLR